jgi:hypothetical protein
MGSGFLERVSTGISGLDRILDHLRPGDNVVWQVDEVEGYRHFAESFARRAVADGRRVVYLRFGEHPQIITDLPGVRVYHLSADRGFEAFVVEAQKAVSEGGEGACYIFDCLSDLHVAWSTDLMIGNFFRIICPYLFELKAIGYFAVLRGRHSLQTIARIRKTTQVLIDLCIHDGRVYIHPLKVWNRRTPTMFLPHVLMGADFTAITSGEAAALFSLSRNTVSGSTERKLDYWDRVFLKARDLRERLKKGDPAAVPEERPMIERLCKMMLGRDERLLSLAVRYFSLEDLLKISDRLIGSGFIGGKAAGMLLARKILMSDENNDWPRWLEAHDSFFVGSDVYYTYLVENGCWPLLVNLREEHCCAAEELRKRIMGGVLPAIIREQFQQMLEYYGQFPIIVRSSGLFEDGFGNSFAGKYESVFCVNQGDPEERYLAFEEGVKRVYASTVSREALSCRFREGTAPSDEQMALLVQRVSGSHHGRYFFPDLAGVALSRNLYIWRDDLDQKAGMVRLVLGLGTRAVERVGDDYPRLVALDRPLLRPDSGPEDIIRYSQRRVDLLNTATNEKETLLLSDILFLKDGINGWELFAERDYETEQRMADLGHQKPEAWVLTFQGLLKETEFPLLMKKMLQTLESAYGSPVSIEFTVNFRKDLGMRINLLQCRPFRQWGRGGARLDREAIAPEDVIFLARDSFMGDTTSLSLQRIVYIDPAAYGLLAVSERYQVARLVGLLNRLHADRRAFPLMLMGPGRWGSSTPFLGVPVSFTEICNAAVIVEMAGDGYMPELSFGTHFFSNLVERNIFYVALFPDKAGCILQKEALGNAPNNLAALLPEYGNWEHVIKVIDAPSLQRSVRLDADLERRQVVCYLT